MREKVTAERLQNFMVALGSRARVAARIYLVGGATALLLGWRDSTIDIDFTSVPDSDQILRSLPELKESLHINIELASPSDFIPELPGWQERSQFIQQVGQVSFFHYDFYAQALAKIERGHEMDIHDVREMIRSRLVEPMRLLELFSKIEDQIYKYPAIDPASFRTAVEIMVREFTSS